MILTGDDVTAVKDIPFDMVAMGQQVGHFLGSEYPWHAWHVDLLPGVIRVRVGGINTKFGFTINTTAIATSSELRAITAKQAGELLERFNIARTRQGAQQIVDAFHRSHGVIIPQL